MAHSSEVLSPPLLESIREDSHKEIVLPSEVTANPSESGPVGVLGLVLQSAHIVHASTLDQLYLFEKKRPNPFVTVSVVGEGKDNVFYDAEELTTEFLRRTYDPDWMTTTKYMILDAYQMDLQDTLSLRFDVRSWSTCRLGHPLLGTAMLPITQILKEGLIQLSLPLRGRGRGRLVGDLLIFAWNLPALPPYGGTLNNVSNDVKAGIITLHILQCENLPSRESGRLPNPVVCFRTEDGIGPSRQLFKTSSCLSTSDPVWYTEHKFFCTDVQATMLSMEVLDRQRRWCGFGMSRSRTSHKCVLGYINVPLIDLVERTAGEENPSTRRDASGQDDFWWPLMDTAKGRARMKGTWRPVELPVATLLMSALVAQLSTSEIFGLMDLCSFVPTLS